MASQATAIKLAKKLQKKIVTTLLSFGMPIQRFRKGLDGKNDSKHTYRGYMYVMHPREVPALQMLGGMNLDTGNPQAILFDHNADLAEGDELTILPVTSTSIKYFVGRVNPVKVNVLAVAQEVVVSRE